MKYTLLLLAVLLIPACGTTKGKVRESNDEFAARIGHDKEEDIAALMGFPQQRGKVGNSEIWIYRTNEVGKVRRIPFAGANGYVTADELILTFDADGVLKTYKLNANKLK